MKNLIFVVIIMFLTVSICASTLVVNQFNGPYYTINDAYTASVDGDVILIYPGTYMRSASISKAITLLGVDPQTTIIQSNSNYGFKIENGNVIIKNLTFDCSNEGIEIYESTPEITNCIFINCNKGIYIDNDAAIVSNCIFKNCSIGLQLYDYSNGIIRNNVFINCNSYGIIINGCNGNRTCYASLYNNIITNCGTGIKSAINYLGSIAYNCFYNNSTNTSGVNLNTGNIYSDPLFHNISESNFYLQATSPCIDTGNPAMEYNDLDGTRNDMGIFGGPYQWGAGAPTVMDITITPESVIPGQTFDIEANGQVK